MSRHFTFLFAPLTLGLLLVASSCQSQTPVKSVKHSAHQTTYLLDSTEAAKVILHDTHDRFFELVGKTEMSIQMKRPLKDTDTRESLLPAFKAYLQADMAHFTAAESRWVADIFRDVYQTVHEVSPGIFPDSLLLIKTHGKHYGDGVYYTRENCIVIPADVLRRGDKAAFKATMYHEIFHVYSRLHPEKRTQLYRLIGFEHVGVDHLKMPAPLAAQALFNPDGVDFGQLINLKMTDGSTIGAVPIIYANQDGFKPGKNEFFAYLEFSLFEVKKQNDGAWKVETMTDGLTSTLNMNQLPDFYRQIRDNTTYIIHPDEVLADNFSFIMLDRDGKQVSKRFSPEGKQLLKDVEAILKN